MMYIARTFIVTALSALCVTGFVPGKQPSISSFLKMSDGKISPSFMSSESGPSSNSNYNFDTDTTRSTARSGSGPASKKVLEDRLAFLEKEVEDKGLSLKGGSAPRAANTQNDKLFWDNAAKLYVQGGSLKTWSYASPAVEAVQVRLQTEGRPLDAAIDLWQGPDNTPERIRVYLEDGLKRPFQCLMLTPRGPNTVAIRNMGQLEFPFLAAVQADVGEERGPMQLPTRASSSTAPMIIQGGALRTFPFDVNVDSVQVLLKTDGRPLNARIELLQGPNNNKQVIEVYTEDGLDRPFYVVLETPGSGNVVRIVNAATVEFPLTALVEAYKLSDSKKSAQAVLGGDSKLW